MSKISENLKIEIRPIPNRGDIKKFSDNLEYFAQSNTIPCLVNPETLKYETGLSDEDKKYLKEQKFPYDISDQWTKGVAHPFWESEMMKVSLGPSPSFLYPGKNTVDFCKYKFLLKSSYIYVSEEEVEEGTKTEATHFIYNKEVEEDIKATRLEKRNNRIEKISKLSLARKRDIIMIIQNENTENKNENYLTIEFEKITKDSKKAEELDALLEEEAKEVTLIAQIKMAIYNNVLKKTNQGIFFFETNLGFSEGEVKEFLKKDENQEILLNIKSKINK